MNPLFIHINKTGGSSVSSALDLPVMHITAKEFIATHGREEWESRFRFTIVRNPWDKVVSHYHYRLKTNQTMLRESGVSFNDWVRLAYEEKDPDYHDKPKMFAPQVDWLRDDNGKVEIHHIIQFESLEAGFKRLCKKLKVKASLPHLKSSDRGDYRQYYDNESVEIISKWAESDIKAFKYVYE